MRASSVVIRDAVANQVGECKSDLSASRSPDPDRKSLTSRRSVAARHGDEAAGTFHWSGREPLGPHHDCLPWCRSLSRRIDSADAKDSPTDENGTLTEGVDLRGRRSGERRQGALATSIFTSTPPGCILLNGSGKCQPTPKKAALQ